MDNPVPTSYTQFTDRLNSITGDLGFAKYLASDKPYTKVISPDLEPQPGTGLTLSAAQVRTIVRLGALGNLNGNGYVNISSAFSPSRSGGYVQNYVSVSQNGQTVVINQMSVGYNAANPSLNYNFRNYGTDVSTVKEYGTGNYVPATTYIYHNDTKQETSDLRITVTNSQRDAYETMMGH